MNEPIVSKTQVKRLGGEFLIVGLGQVMTVLGGLVGIRILTECMSPYEYGTLSLGMTGVMLISRAFFQPLSSASVRFFGIACDRSEGDVFLSTIFRYLWRIIYSGSFIIVGLTIVLLFMNISQTFYLGLCFVFALLNGAVLLFNNVQTSLRHRIVVSFHDATFAWLRISLAAIMIWYFGDGTPFFAMAGYTIAGVLVLVSELYFFRRCVRPIVDAVTDPSRERRIGYWKNEIRKFTVPLMFFAIFVWAQNASPRWALKAISAENDLGVYAALFQLGCYPITMLFTVVAKFAKPILFRRAGGSENHAGHAVASRLNSYITLVFVFLTIVVTVVTWYFSDSIIRFFIKRSEYWYGARYLPLMVVIGGCTAIGRNMGHQFMISAKTWLFLFPQVIVPLLTVGIIFIGALKYGLPGVIYAHLIVVVIKLLCNIILNSTINKHIEPEEPSNEC